MHLSLVDSTPARRKADSARQVRDLLRAQILGRGFAGGQMPGETDLMREFQVGRNVVRAALAQLQDQGLIVRIQGAGTFVAVQKTRHSLRNGGISSSLVDGMAQLETRVLSHRLGTAGGTVAVRLDVPDGTPCLVVDSVTSIDREPMIVATSYVADAARLPALLDVVRTGQWRGDWYDALVAAGLTVHRRELVAEAVAADDLVAADLEVPLGSPVMFVERRVLDEAGTPAEYGFSHCRGDRVAFAYQAETTRKDAGPR
jgi:GntR family transcriptional regulator